MPYLLDELTSQADAAVAAMQEAALAARHAHARAELMRHMLGTARHATEGRSRADAIELVVREWMGAWALDRDAWPDVAREMEALTVAFLDYAAASSAAADAALRRACASLDAALARRGTTISDEMAWRSQCAHGWWGWVCPVPDDLPGRKPRPGVPQPEEGEPFWDAGCAARCR